MAYPTRNISTQGTTLLNTGSLLQENGDFLLQENGDQILIENPYQNPNLSARNVSSYNLPTRN